MWLQTIRIFCDKSCYFISLLSKQDIFCKMSVSLMYLMLPFFPPDMPYFHEQKTGQECIIENSE